ncbi:LysR family transcriptional regulator [Paenibacillus sp. NEAU-GSW1]|uniref:LysR family transcriptional regulator n=1 Tax=Paenibacillus sp. NEAU-GSW1 TaxID=2682486 RepID=UPI0012E193E4|nr:LysR family transcriptional regulator [Paenibacillus sp. NEAU-GSW1]MUT66934.1 LysR family transcriptional regulator [Paenibacillus sp. NEAU-GSW1]
MIPNLENYRIFLYTAQSGNFTKAAQMLHITQPSVSYAIKQLEEQTGAKLFDRLSKGVRLTAEGKALYDYVEQSFTLLVRGEKKLRELVNMDAGELKIGASGPIIKHVLLPYLEKFHEQYPHIRIRLLQIKTSEVARQLQEELIDLGLVHLPLADEALDVTPLLEIEDRFVVGNAYKQYAGQPITAKQLCEIPLLMPTSGSSTRVFVEQWLARQGVHKEPDIELTSTEMIMEFAERGYGAAFIARQFASKEFANGTLHELTLTEPIPSRMIGIVTRKGASLPSASAFFLEKLRP